MLSVAKHLLGILIFGGKVTRWHGAFSLNADGCMLTAEC